MVQELQDIQTLENAIIAFQEGASDEKRMALDSATDEESHRGLSRNRLVAGANLRYGLRLHCRVSGEVRQDP